MNNIWLSGYFAKLFLNTHWRIQLAKEGLLLNESLINWRSVEYTTVQKGLIWNQLTIKHKDGESLINGLSKRLSAIVITCIETVGKSQETIEIINSRFEKDLYFRNSEFLKIKGYLPNKEQLIKLLNNKKIDIEILISKKEQQILLEVINEESSRINDWNRLFVKKEIEKYDLYFKSVESEPLTEEQIKASIIMEDNNLLIAAAGSGKTSVIVSKLGYLIQKNYAKPEEILILSFNNKVKDEINHRINKSLNDVLKGHENPVVHTFHSYGYSVVKDGKLNKRTPAWIASEAKTLSHLKNLFYTVLKNNLEIAAEIALFITFDDIDDDEETSKIFKETETDSIDELSKLSHKDINPKSISLHQTLSGKHVRSFQELKISNWLILFGIEYKYEKELSIEGIDHYRPDFYYEKVDCWHEHFGINKFGKAPSHFFKNGKISYEDTVKLKRRELNKAKVNWFETTSADFYDNTWHLKLDNKLRGFGENPEFIGWDKYQQIVKKFNKENESNDFSELPLISLLLESIKHFKNNQFTLEDIENKISKIKRNDRYQRYFKIFKAIYEEYERVLNAENHIDFEDMLSESTALICENKVTHSFKFILIDEFQDMSNSRARLIQALKKQDPNTILFGVGDDWQSIYRFAGSDSSNMLDFEKKFGFSSINKLNKTFRFNQGIADISSEFILKNKLQLAKEVTANNPGRKNRVRYFGHEKIRNLPTRDTKDFDRVLLNQLKSIKAHALSKNTKVTVALLGRYNYLKPDNFDELVFQYRNWLDISFSTIHSAKGLGWDFVVILGMDHKFPSTKSDDDLLSLFMIQPDIYPDAEERRLFYVALTRAKVAVILLGNEEKPSSFLFELNETKFQDVISFA